MISVPRELHSAALFRWHIEWRTWSFSAAHFPPKKNQNRGGFYSLSMSFLPRWCLIPVRRRWMLRISRDRLRERLYHHHAWTGAISWSLLFVLCLLIPRDFSRSEMKRRRENYFYSPKRKYEDNNRFGVESNWEKVKDETRRGGRGVVEVGWLGLSRFQVGFLVALLLLEILEEKKNGGRTGGKINGCL